METYDYAMQLAAYKKTPPTELNLNTQQVILQTDFITFFPGINNEYVQLFNTKNMVKLCFTCWKKQQKKKRGKKKAKHQRAQIATIAQAVQMALKMWGKNTASYIPIACIRWKSTLIRKSPQNGKGQKSRLQWGHTLKYNTACFCCCCCCLLFLNTGI